MTELSVTILDASTNEVVVRPFTQQEMADYSVIVSESATFISELEKKEQARASALAKLAALGLTETEIAAL
jgi:hypothetical protein